MKLTLPIAVVLIVIAMTTVLQGRKSERWPFAESRTESLQGFSARLDYIPMDVGNWKGTDEEVNQEEFAASNCDKCVSRVYRNEITGESVSVYLVSGVSRHITIHTPDWCYVGAGFEMESEQEPFTMRCGANVKDAEFLTTTFRKEDRLGSNRLRIFWAFTDNGDWKSPRNPKPEYAGRPAMFKVYLITGAGPRMAQAANSPAVAFGEEFLPIANQILFGPAPGGAETAPDGTSEGLPDDTIAAPATEPTPEAAAEAISE